MQLSALECGQAGLNRGVPVAVDVMVQVASEGERSGLKRIWCTEHHVPTAATASPDLLIPYLADATSNIRVGVAGFLLRLHRPFLIAERVAFLSHMYPGRIDLGIGRGTAAAEIEAQILEGQDPSCQSPFEQRVKSLITLLSGDQSPYFGSPKIDTWILGSRSTSADIARVYGLNYCHSLFFDASTTQLPTGTTAVGIAGICATTKKEAQELLQKAGRSAFAPMLVDDPEGCLRLLVQLKSENPGLREIVFMDLAIDPARHVESYLLLSSALEEHNRRQG